jgi:hypothetical protein
VGMMRKPTDPEIEAATRWLMKAQIDKDTLSIASFKLAQYVVEMFETRDREIQLEQTAKRLLDATYKLRDYHPRTWEMMVREEYDAMRRVLNERK